MTPTGVTPTVDELWLATFQRLCARSAHDVRSALNGVSVNLEVVRARSAKADLPASTVHRYAAAAAEQLDAVMMMAESLLALGRAPREPVEVVPLVRRLVTLLAPGARSDGGRLEIGAIDDGSSATSSSNVVRTVLGAALLAAVDGVRAIECRVAMGERIEVSLNARSGEKDAPLLALDSKIVDAATGAGIGVLVERSGISIAFPRADVADGHGHAESAGSVRELMQP
jgi:hypothetical protein